jgi:chromosome segregation ATPase
MKQALAVDDELVDEIVDEVLKSQRPFKSKSDEIGKLKARIADLEHKLDKYISSFKLNATESVRRISEVDETLTSENEKQLIALQGQLNDLRTAMIRLSNEVKKLKEKLGED